ncbi:MAG: polysaccharide pyruvyl transferase family protein [Zavarzinella sp.]
MHRREFLAASAGMLAAFGISNTAEPKRIILRSSWQTENIGDIAHTPGMLTLLEEHRQQDVVTLWPSGLSEDVERLLLKRFPKLTIVKTTAEKQAALQACDFFLHGSGPGLVGAKDTELARTAGKPYGFAGVTLSDAELKTHRELLANAKFVYTRDSDSLKALQATGIKGPTMAFGPDATFALDIHDESAADKLLKKYQLEAGKFLCAIPRLRWTPYWEIRPERVKPNPERSAVNEAFAERDHAKMREAIIAWVTKFEQKVFLVPEMTYAVTRLKPLLFDPLPEKIKQHVVVMDRYWLTAEAASVYARAAAMISFEQHSPIIAVANGTPAMLLRQPTDTRKGQMWRDIGLDRWIFEIDDATGTQIADRLLELGSDLPKAREVTKKAHQFTLEKMGKMVAAIG